MLLGCHVSIAGGLEKLIERALDLNCQTIQIFSRSPRGGKAKPFDAQEVAKFRTDIEKNNIAPIVVHMPYVLNLSAETDEMFKYAQEMLQEDLARANTLGAKFLVVHAGSHKGKGEDFGLKRMIQSIAEVMATYQGECQLLIENTSGAGSELGYSLEQLKYLLDQIDHPMVNICYDTCHGFTAGYDISTGEKADALVEQLDKLIGIERIKVIHTNDSKYAINTRKDRHEHIGKGFIGLAGFKALLNNPKLQNKPFILETPVDDEGDYVTNLAILKSLIANND